MEEQSLFIARVMATAVLSTGFLVVIGLVARILWRKGSVQNRELPVSPERLERLELAVDAIALEVERISEAQRFTVNLLSERLPTKAGDRVAIPAPRAAQQRHDTPH